MTPEQIRDELANRYGVRNEVVMAVFEAMRNERELDKLAISRWRIITDIRKEQEMLRQQLEVATTLLRKVHQDATQAPGGYLISGATLGAIDKTLEAREVVE